MLQVMKAEWVWTWFLCGGYGCLVLLQPKVPRSKNAAGHVGVALPTSSCQAGMQNLRFCLVCGGMPYKRVWKGIISGSNWHVTVYAQADIMQGTRRCLKGAMLERERKEKRRLRLSASIL